MAAVDPPADLLQPLRHDTRGLANVLERVLPKDENGETPQLLLLVDQFEELFTLVEDDEQRHHFLDSLFVALSDPRSPLHVVVTLRADFYDQPLDHGAIAALVTIATVYGLHEQDGTRFLAMELILGQDLSAALAFGAAGVAMGDAPSETDGEIDAVDDPASQSLERALKRAGFL